MDMLDLALETEEYITAEEYLRRREAGAIDASKIRYALDNPVKGQIGGFYVKLNQPRYKMAIKSVLEKRTNAILSSSSNRTASIIAARSASV